MAAGRQENEEGDRTIKCMDNVLQDVDAIGSYGILGVKDSGRSRFRVTDIGG